MKARDHSFRVIRSGKVRVISVYDILTGDVALLEAGDIIPADGILIGGHGIRCDDASITGESDLMDKTPGKKAQRLLEDKSLDHRGLDPFVFGGARVVQGVGSFLVTSTGIYSGSGKMNMVLREDRSSTPLQKRLSWLAVRIARIGFTVSLALFFALLGKFAGRVTGSEIDKSLKGLQFLSILIIALTLLDVVVPSGLPLAVTVALQFATTRLLK